MGAFCCCKPRKPNEEKPKRTSTGKLINEEIMDKFITEKQQNKMRETKFEWTIILNDPYKAFTQITDYLYLTGYGGITQENMTSYAIKHMYTVAYDVPFHQVPGVESIKLSVDDDDDEDLYKYFNSVSENINKWTEKKEPTVVHCMCGISRSTTFVLAYLMKYKGYPLNDAFDYVHERRPIVRPNNGFFEQLVKYEKSLLKETKSKKTPTKMVTIKTKAKLEVKVPKFLAEKYPLLAKSTEKPKDSTINMSDASSTISYYSKTG